MAKVTPSMAKNQIKRSLLQIIDTHPNKSQKQQVWNCFDNKCAYCDIVIDPNSRKGHLDHLQAVKDGGTNEIYNFVLACNICNGDEKREMMTRIYGLAFESKDALKLTEELQSFIANEAYKTSALLAKEKGAFPLYNQEKYLGGEFVKNLSEETITLNKENGLRNSHLLSIQPTGNTSILANNVSGGLEPIFMPVYTRTSILPYTPLGLEVPININWVIKAFLIILFNNRN